MKLLFDQNLSHTLKALLADIYPQSAHVRDVGLDRAHDQELWEFAKRHCCSADPLISILMER